MRIRSGLGGRSVWTSALSRLDIRVVCRWPGQFRVSPNARGKTLAHNAVNPVCRRNREISDFLTDLPKSHDFGDTGIAASLEMPTCGVAGHTDCDV